MAQEVIKHSDAFQLHLPADIENFSELPVGYLLAEDLSDTRWVIDEPGTRIIFPIPKSKRPAGRHLDFVPAEDVQLA